MSDVRAFDMPKAWQASDVEASVYQRWEAAGCFRAGAGKRSDETFTIVIPPPNVTGRLHMGHALNNTLQDTLIRWQRMLGKDVLWQPGTDHAGIATEAVVAKQLQSQGLHKEEMQRDEFLKHVWAWKEEYGDAIIDQLRTMGCSCDWERSRFTMDEGLSAAVRENFVKLYEAGLIYQGTRMVNWDPVLQTALSDDEVEPLEKDGSMWKLRYTLSDGSGFIDVETTRPETFFADSAVAVHPEDARYQAMIGKTVRLPLVDREIPIVADEHANPEKGTGAVKITPFHDPNDYEVGLRHDLPLHQCVNFDGTMGDMAGTYAGQHRYECRKNLLRDLAANGVLQGETKIKHSVGHGDRSGVPVEPMVTKQWFVKMKPLADRALGETANGNVAFHPERWTKVYSAWLEDVRDWCISRQIMWGHQIPAWHCPDCGHITVDREDPSACASCGSKHITQGPDVLDTWFSSALWPFSTLGWPQQTDELARYYPTSVLSTDRGIIYFWVARMVMIGLFNLNTRPFSDVYIHGTVLDEKGAKMSKSKGNGIDPLIMINGGAQDYLGKTYESPGFGADAVRYTLLDMTTEGQDLKLAPTRFEAGRNFVNKVYNAGRFLLMNMAERPLDKAISSDDVHSLDLGFEERWLLDRLQHTINQCNQALERFRFSDYVSQAYRFFRDDLCDWYLEWAKHQFAEGGSKAAVSSAVLYHAFDTILRLLHPGMPFITEYLWQELQSVSGSSSWERGFLMTTEWPSADDRLVDDDLAPRMTQLQDIVSAVRNVRNQQGLADNVPLQVLVAPGSEAEGAALANHAEFLTDRGNLSEFAVEFGCAKPAASVSEVVGLHTIHVPLKGVIDGEKFRAQLEKQLQAKQKSAAGKRGRLANPGYTNKAPPAMVEQTRQLLAEEEAEIAKIEQTIAEFQ